MKKDLWKILLIILFMYMSFCGQYMNNGKMSESEASLNGLIDCILLTLIMIAVPLIFRIINKKRLSLSKGKKICKWNSIILFTISIIILIIFISNGYNGFFFGVGGLGAIFYYYVNKWLFVYKSDEEYFADANDNKLEKKSKKEKNKKKYNPSYCKQCGGEINNYRICSKCGKDYNHKKILITLLIIQLLIVIVMTIIIINQKITIDDNLFYENYYYDNYDKLNFYDENIVFVIEGYGKKYYSYDCMYKITTGKFRYYIYNRDQAIYLGYKKGICN